MTCYRQEGWPDKDGATGWQSTAVSLGCIRVAMGQDRGRGRLIWWDTENVRQNAVRRKGMNITVRVIFIA